MKLSPLVLFSNLSKDASPNNSDKPSYKYSTITKGSRKKTNITSKGLVNKVDGIIWNCKT